MPAPQGLKMIARGFNPWKISERKFPALKGPKRRAILLLNTDLPILSPFRAGKITGIRPGVSPLAIILSPCGAKEFVGTP